MNQRDIAIKRLSSQHIENQRFKLPAELVSWLGAVQGQDYAGAKWSIGLRLNGIKDSDVEQALKNKTIVRTSALRGTLHFVAHQIFIGYLRSYLPVSYQRILDDIEN